MDFDFTYNILAIPVFITSIIFLFLAVIVFNKKGDNGESYFGGLLVGCFLYAFFYGFELLGTNDFTIILTYKLQYIGGAAITPFLLLFTLKYSGNERFLIYPIPTLLFVISSIFVLALFTNDLHGYFYPFISSEYNGLFNAITYQKGPLDIAYEGYNNFLIVLSTLVLIKMYLSVAKPYKKQVLVLLIGTTIPWSAHSMALLGFNYYNFDFVPLTLLLSAIFIYRGLFRHGLFQRTPVAFKTIFENLSDGILILDQKHNIIASNKKANAILNNPKQQLHGANISLLFDKNPELKNLFEENSSEKEIEISDLNNGIFISCFIKRASEENLLYLFLRDISTQKLAEERIRQNEGKLQRINTALLRNEKMLTSIAFATKELLSNSDLIKAIQKAISILGDGAGADRAYLFENKIDEGGNYFSSQRFEWSGLGVEPEIDNPNLQDLPIGLFGESMEYLLKNQIYTNIVSQIEDPGLKGLLESQEIVSILLIPIFVEKNFWGFVGFDDCQKEKIWSEGETTLLISFAESISNAIERRNMEESLRISMQNAKEASVAKSEFLANMSHEIRTPLNGIVGFSDLLMKTSLNATQKEFLKSIVDSGHLLLDLVNDVLDFSKIEAGKLELSPEKVHLSQLAHESAQLIRPMVEEKGLEFSVFIDPKLPEHLYADSTRLKQVLINLLSNAAKFTKVGKIDLEITHLEDKGRDQVHFELAVKDTGIGISEEKRDLIFEAFAQEDNSTTRKYGGTGLGLSISNKILHLMGSKMELSTQIGKGSRFSFKLILPKYKEQEQVKSSPGKTLENKEKSNSQPVQKEKVKILLVDDNPVNMLLAKTIVKNIVPSCITLEANNGLQAVERFKEASPHMIFMDIQMPEMSGYEATIEIRKLENGQSRVPIVALTAGTVKGEMDRCLEAGMDDYLSKPVVVADIQKKIEKFLQIEDPKDEDAPILSKLEEFRNSDPEFFKELVMVSKENLGKLKHDLNLIWNSTKDQKSIKQTCHAIKGVALNLNLNKLSGLVIKVEEYEKLSSTDLDNLISEIHQELDVVIHALDTEIEKAG
ncbi:MAG: histidine kinase N-terminal 7TM domain-containing protein [Cyclobacteriaceae bacterium]